MNRTVSLKRVNTLPSVANICIVEEQLDAAIFYCLNALTKRYSPSDQFRAIFVKGMFLKPNTKAFVHVLHFLFNIYDTKEFRKRFYWPIFDKTAETAFRSSTVEYINWLVDQGRLETEKIKAHTVVLPGGIKFMKFLLVLIRFVLKEQQRKSRSGNCGKIVAKSDVKHLLANHAQWEEIGSRMREILQNDLSLISSRIQQIDYLFGDLFSNCLGPAKQMNFEKLMQIWGKFNRTYFDETEGRRQRILDVTAEYEKLVVSAKRKLEPKEITLKVNPEDLKETLYRLEVLFPDNAFHFRDVFDECEKIDAIKLFEIIIFMLPEIEQRLKSFTVRSIESLKFELKELSRVAVKSDSLCHEMASLRRSLPFIDAKFQELATQEELDELNSDLGIRNKIFNTPPISLNFQENGEGGAVTKPIPKRYRIALFDDDQVQQHLRMRLLSSSVCHAVPKTPRSAKKVKSKDPSASDNVFAIPKPARKEKMNPLSMLNKITSQGKSKSRSTSTQMPVNSTMNLSSLSHLEDITLRPEFSSTLLGTPEKQTSHNRRSINANETLITKSDCQSVPSMQNQQLSAANTPKVHGSPRYKTIYSENLIQQTTTTKTTMSPDSLFLLSQTTTRTTTTRRRSSIVHFEQLQTSPSGKLNALMPSEITPEMSVYMNNTDCDHVSTDAMEKEIRDLPRIQISEFDELDSGISDENRLAENVLHSTDEADEQQITENMEHTLNAQQNSELSDLSNTLVDLNLSKLSISCAKVESTVDTNRSFADIPLDADGEDLFNVSDGILADID
ncbi:augmin complex subunit dgt6 [Wyeomyia smithii]|uniref:augmin complex subunit dgt6 n=1 Tax=Wyeomyia smithii TaxID=174621 RepID=UPI0024680775|nr:augmin complex subunit dgt6 [Wyeomyia smithii]